MSTLTVAASATARVAGAIDWVVASLPLSLAYAAPDTGGRLHAQLHAVAGAEGWPARALQAVSEGAEGLLIVCPIPMEAELSALLTAIAERGLPVVVDSPLAANPTVAHAAARFAAALAGGGGSPLLETRTIATTSEELEQSLLDQLLLLRALLGEVHDVRVVHRDGHSYQAVAATGSPGGPVETTVTGILSRGQPPRTSVRLLTPPQSLDLVLPTWDTARPARLSTTSSDGEHISPSIYESAHRASWRRLHRLVTTGSTSSDLAGWCADAVTAARAGVWTSSPTR